MLYHVITFVKWGLLLANWTTESYPLAAVIEQLLYPFIVAVAGGVVVVAFHELFDLLKKITLTLT